MTLSTAIADYLSSLAAEGRSPRTVDAYRRDLDRLVAFLGPDADVAKVTPPQLLAFASSPAMAGADGAARHPTSNNRTRSAVRGLFGYLTTAWVLERDPSKALRVRAVDPPRPRVLAEPEEVKLRATMTEDDGALAARDRLMVDVLLATGIRVSSLVGLDVDDVDLDAERLWIRAKGARRMSVALPRALGERLLTGAADGPLFRSRLGTRLGARAVQLRMAGWVAEAGIREAVSPHALHHTCATRMYRETKDLRRVQVALGHRSVMTTERYVGV